MGYRPQKHLTDEQNRVTNEKTHRQNKNEFLTNITKYKPA